MHRRAFMTYIRINLQSPSSSGSVVTAIESKPQDKFFTTTSLLFYILSDGHLNECCILSQHLLSYINSGR
jgi:hypothetical protein